MTDISDAFTALESALPLPQAARMSHVQSVFAEPSRAIAPVAPSDPARLGYPPTFPFEIALRTSTTRAICEAYGIAEDEWELIRHHPAFLDDLDRAVKVVREEGMSFKIKAKLQAEELLKTSWRLIHDNATPANVKADLVKATMRWAEYDTPPQKDSPAAAGRGSFVINMHFSNTQLTHTA